MKYKIINHIQKTNKMWYFKFFKIKKKIHNWTKILKVQESFPTYKWV
jgi:hypothetical protein